MGMFATGLFACGVCGLSPGIDNIARQIGRQQQFDSTKLKTEFILEFFFFQTAER
jgi:hypothetical protein